MSNVLMFGDIIMNILRNNKFECHDKEDDGFLQRFIIQIFICTGSHFKNVSRRKAHTSV